jgi:hypothetical protein
MPTLAYHCLRGSPDEIQQILDMGFLYPAVYRYEVNLLCSKIMGRPIVNLVPNSGPVFAKAIDILIRKREKEGRAAREKLRKKLGVKKLPFPYAGTALECEDVLANDHWQVFLAYNRIPEFDACAGSTTNGALLGFRVEDLEEMGAKYRTTDLITEYREILRGYATIEMGSPGKLARMIEDKLTGVREFETRSREQWLKDYDEFDPAEMVCDFPVPTDLAISLLIKGKEVRWRP